MNPLTHIHNTARPLPGPGADKKKGQRWDTRWPWGWRFTEATPDLLQAEQAVRAAHETATHEENIAENKYDTLGLEAVYLVTGQVRRAEAIRRALANWRQFCPRPYDVQKGVQLGALVCLVDSDDKQQHLFLGPDGGSMKLVSGTQLVQVISSEAPLGRAMLGKCEGDEVSIQVARIPQQFEVLRVH